MARLVSRVRKRDGSEESFDGPRLADSLRAAAVGVENLERNPDAWSDSGLVSGDGWADGMVEALRLEFGHTSRTIPTTEIARIAVQLLQQAGMHRAARNYTDFRKVLEEAVARLRVHSRQGKKARSRPWDRHQLSLSLVRDRYLDLTTARRVSSLVERRLVMADLGHITARLIRALADNECRSLGIRADPLATEFVGVDRSELRAWLGGDCLPSVMGAPHLGPEGGDLRPALGEELLARFAIEEVLSPSQAEGLSQGRFHLPYLGDWMRPCRMLLRWQTGETEADFWHRVRDAQHQAHELQVFIPRRADWTETSLEAPSWFPQTGHPIRWLSDCPELVRGWAQAGHWVRMTAAKFAALPTATQQHLANTDRVTLTWQPPRRLPPAAEQLRETVDSIAVVNLARCAMETGPWQMQEFMDQVTTSLDLACGTMEALLSRGRGLEHARVVLLPVGLETALRTLLPEEALGGDRIRRTILSLRAMFDRHARAAQLRPEHGSPPHPGPAGARLAQCDGRNPEASYAIGWGLNLATGVPAATSFQTAPWLQFSAAAAVQDLSWLPRIPKLDADPN
jgi:hypothetical protein